MPVSDEQLMQQIAQGQRGAFAELYDRLAARVLGVIVKMLPDRSDADDVLQEAFWQVWQRADRYDPNRSSPITWVVMIARSRAIDQRRRRRTEVLPDSMEPDPAEENQAIDLNETGEVLAGVLAKLPSEQAQAIHLSYFEGLTHFQISERLAAPVGTIKTRIRRGMQRLRGFVQEQAERSSR